MISMVDLKPQYQALKSEIDAGIQSVLENAHFILGSNVQAFEKECASFLGMEHAIGCASGTDALMLALRAAGIGEGDEVITTPFTFIATAEAIRYVGAKPVFVDIDEQSFNLVPEQVERALTSATRAVLPVHLFGQPANMKKLVSLCEAHGLQIIEDCAQSFGAHIDGRQTGSFGIAGCFSFFPSKNLGCFGDGGLITTHSAVFANDLRALRNHGSHQQYHHDVIGYNSRLDELQAVILRAKLKHIDTYNALRRQVANHYNRLLADVPVIIPTDDSTGYHVFHQYTLLSPRRDHIMQRLREADIASAIYYPIPLHRQEVFAEEYRDISLPVSERIAKQCLSLPIYPELSTEAIERIAECVRHAH